VKGGGWERGKEREWVDVRERANAAAATPRLQWPVHADTLFFQQFFFGEVQTESQLLAGSGKLKVRVFSVAQISGLFTSYFLPAQIFRAALTITFSAVERFRGANTHLGSVTKSYD